MIYRLATHVGDALAARQYPVRVVYGPERVSHSLTASAIVIERDRDSGDTFENVRGAFRNAKHPAIRMVGARATVYWRAAVAGARVQDHEDECDAVVDALYCAVDSYMQASARINLTPVSEARYLRAEEIAAEGLETWAGVVYRLRWRMPRGVASTTYLGLGLPTAAPAATTSGVHVRRNGADPPEVVEIP